MEKNMAKAIKLSTPDFKIKKAPDFSRAFLMKLVEPVTKPEIKQSD